MLWMQCNKSLKVMPCNYSASQLKVAVITYCFLALWGKCLHQKIIQLYKVHGIYLIKLIDNNVLKIRPKYYVKLIFGNR